MKTTCKQRVKELEDVLEFVYDNIPATYCEHCEVFRGKVARALKDRHFDDAIDALKDGIKQTVEP